MSRDVARLTLLGAAGTVTGSKFWIRASPRQYLIESGVFQSDDELEQRDWRPLPVRPAEIDAVLLTHAHIDHSGYLPRLVADGYRGPVYATPGTIALLRILLPDSAYLQEEQAAYANKKRYSRHHPAKPLFTMRDADAALALLRPMRFGETTRVDETLSVTPRPAGHLLGSSTLELSVGAGADPTTVVFSGDLGRYGQEVMADPEPVPRADHLVLESTYGDRLHGSVPPRDTLRRAIEHAYAHQGVVLIPCFAVGRAQHILYHLRRLQDEHAIPRIPIFLDSPMAIDATGIYSAHGDDPNLRIRLGLDKRHDSPLACRDLRFVRKREESKRLNTRRGPMVIISANGMCTGGRIVHHLKTRLPHEENAMLFVGYQGQGTRGRHLRGGARTTRIHGEPVEVRARIFELEGLSGHADQGEILRWLGGMTAPPRRTILVHGEPDALRGLHTAISRTLGWPVHVGALDEAVDLA